MQRRIHMRDQVGANKIEEIMTHFDRCSMGIWGMKVLLLAAFLLLGVSW